MLILFISIRLFFLCIYPTQDVSQQSTNLQKETVCDYKYLVFDTNLKNMNNYKKEYIVVIDKKPFTLNSYEKSFEEIMVLNYILKEENSDFNYSNMMMTSGKSYYKISKEAYDKINKLKDLKGVYTYIKDTKESRNAWGIENYFGNISINKKYNKDSLQNTLQKYIKNNNTAKEEFSLNEKSVYIKEGIKNINNNKNIKLTIDLSLQDKIKKVLLDDKYKKLNNIGVILLESDTGKIKAMAQKDESLPNINLCAKGMGYEPGSVYKLITLASALEEGKITMNDFFYCSCSICNICHGKLTVSDALSKSCNDIFGKIGFKTEYKKLIEYSKKLGLYNKVLLLEEESAGTRPKVESGISNISIGQCFTVTPIQIAGAINCIVNDGIYVKPYIVESVIDNDDKDIYKFSTDNKRVFSLVTSKLVKNAMIQVVNKGTGINAKLDGVEIGGKTGSATSGTQKTTHGWFAGYFKYKDKYYTMVVFVPDLANKIKEDDEELGGGNTAAPVFKSIVSEIVQNND